MKAKLYFIYFLFTVSFFTWADDDMTGSWQDYILEREIIELLEYHQFTIEDLYFFKNDNYIIHASLSPDKEMIAFVVHTEDSAKLFITKLIEKSVKPVILESALAWQWAPQWSKDCMRLAFFASKGSIYEIYIVNHDGSSLKKIAQGNTSHFIYSLTWSPDGEQLAFELDSNIYIVKKDGSNLLKLTDGNNDYVYPVWLPNGNGIVCFRNFPGEVSACVLDTGGTNIIKSQIKLEDCFLGFGLSLPLMCQSSFSPDGEKIIIIFNITPPQVSSIYFQAILLNLEDDCIICLSDNEFSVIHTCQHSFSADSKKIVFTINGAIIIMNTDGSSRVKIFEKNKFFKNPYFTDNGDEVIFFDDEYIYSVKTDGTDKKIIGPITAE